MCCVKLIEYYQILRLITYVSFCDRDPADEVPLQLDPHRESWNVPGAPHDLVDIPLLSCSPL